MQIQNLTVDNAEIANGMGRDGFEPIESNDIKEMLKSQDEDLTKTEF